MHAIHTHTNSYGITYINALELAAYVIQFSMNIPHIPFLDHYLDSTKFMFPLGWINKLSCT